MTEPEFQTMTYRWIILLLVTSCLPLLGYAEQTERPLYKPASRAPEPMDITLSTYGANRSAPNALGIGDTAPDFLLPRAGGGSVSLAAVRKHGPVTIIFYRGHW
jgi:hypothetical protein